MTFTKDQPKLDDLSKLRALAQAATPGPWRYGVDIDQLSDGGKGYPLDYYPDCRTVVEISCRECGERSDIAETDAAFIAAANPQTVIALLDDNEQLRAACAKWQDYFTGTPGLAAANAEIVALRAQLTAMTAARDELADMADEHIFAPTGNNIAAAGAGLGGQAFKILPGGTAVGVRPEGPYEHPFTAAQPFHAVAAAAPVLGETHVVTVDSGKPYRDKARIAELRKVGAK